MNQHIERAGLEDLKIVKALGAGGFGLVKLVQVKGISTKLYNITLDIWELQQPFLILKLRKKNLIESLVFLHEISFAENL